MSQQGLGCLGKSYSVVFWLKVLWFGLQQMLLSPSCHIKSPASGVSDPALWEVSTDDVIWTTRCFIFNMSSYHFCLLTFSYRQAQATVLAALPLLNKHSIATKRPDDYFAEMAKTDQHMQKVSFLFLLLLFSFFLIPSLSPSLLKSSQTKMILLSRSGKSCWPSRR